MVPFCLLPLICDGTVQGFVSIPHPGNIAQSFKGIHRSNLIGMAVFPLRFAEGQNAESLFLNGSKALTSKV